MLYPAKIDKRKCRPKVQKVCTRCAKTYLCVNPKSQACSKACKHANWLAKNDGYYKKEAEEQACEECGGAYLGVYRRRFCTTACKGKAQYREQHAENAKVVVCETCSCEFCPLIGCFAFKFCKSCGDAALGNSKRVRLAAQKVATLPKKIFSDYLKKQTECACCGVGLTREPYLPSSAELDHLVPTSKGGVHAISNAQALCRACNGFKAAKPVRKWLIDLGFL